MHGDLCATGKTGNGAGAFGIGAAVDRAVRRESQRPQSRRAWQKAVPTVRRQSVDSTGALLARASIQIPVGTHDEVLVSQRVHVTDRFGVRQVDLRGIVEADQFVRTTDVNVAE